MKKIMTLFIASIFMFGITIANDCNKVANDGSGNIKIIKNWNNNKILPNEAIEKAAKNLQKFCCTENSLKNDLDYCSNSVDLNWDFASSAYLYDHILDVSLRRLDAKIENENGENLMYWLTWDPKWKAWRDFITKHGNSYNWSVPIEIINEYKKNWEIKNNTIKARNLEKNKDWWEKSFENYDERTLWEKYAWICETSVYTYLNLSSEFELPKLIKAYENCKSLRDNRIKNEFDYTKSIIMQKGNKLLHINIGTYLDKYFSQDKMTELQQLIFNMKNIFNEVTKAVIKLVPICS